MRSFTSSPKLQDIHSSPLRSGGPYFYHADAAQPLIDEILSKGPLSEEEQRVLTRLDELRLAGAVRESYHREAALVERAISEAPQRENALKIRNASQVKLRRRYQENRDRVAQLAREQELRAQQEEERRKAAQAVEEHRKKAEAEEQSRRKEEEANRQAELERIREMHRLHILKVKAQQEEEERMQNRWKALRRDHELREEAERKARQEQEALRRAQREQERKAREAEQAARRARLEQERKAKEAEDAARRLRERWEREAAERERKRKEQEAADAAMRERLERERMEREAAEAAWRARMERERMEREAAAGEAAWRAHLERERMEREAAAAEAAWRAHLERERMEREAAAAEASWRAHLERERAAEGRASDSREQRIKAFCDEYELKWAELKTNPGLTATVTFHQFPFPVLPSSLPLPEEITYERVREFMFHEYRTSNKGKTRRAILKTEALRWHPDRFAALIQPKVQQDDWLAVKEAAELVARCVTGWLAEA